MAQRHSIVTVVGRNKEAAKTANNQPMVFTEIALGDGTRFPSGGETALENEVHRGQITDSGVESAEPNAVWFDLYVPANVNTFYAQEIGLFDEDGLLYAVSRFDQPVPKFGPDSSSLSDNTFRIVVVFSDTENVLVNISPVAGITAENLPQHLPFATDAQASETSTLGKIMQVKQAHDLFALYHDTTITGDNTSESPLSVRTAEGEQPGIVSLGDIDSRFLALIRNNPTFPEIQTADNRLALTDDGAGIVKVDASQTWIWRGLIQMSADDFDLADRSFATSANKTYHLRWDASGTGDATPEANWPNGRFELVDLTGATPAETDPIYDSTFDRMLIARIVTDGANSATITKLGNKANLTLSAFQSDTGNSNSTEPDLARNYQANGNFNWARVPTNFSHSAVLGATEFASNTNTLVQGVANWTDVTRLDRYGFEMTILTDWNGTAQYGYGIYYRLDWNARA